MGLYNFWLPGSCKNTPHYSNTSHTNVYISCLAIRSQLAHYSSHARNGRESKETKEDVAGVDEKEKKEELPSNGPERQLKLCSPVLGQLGAPCQWHGCHSLYYNLINWKKSFESIVLE